MCDFISLATTDRKEIYYFDCEKRQSMPVDSRGNRLDPDSHASICEFFRINEDAVNKYEWNPFSNTLYVDTKQFDEDTEYIRNHLNEQDWSPICGDLEGARAFIETLKDGSYLNLNLSIPEGVRVFDTWEEADAAICSASRSAGLGAVRGATHNAANASILCAVGYSSRYPAFSAAEDAAYDAARATNACSLDAARYCAIKYALDDRVEIEPEHIAYVNKRWAINQAGYRVVDDVAGVLYCYDIARRMR